ncbi:MAG: hypothetical protein IKU19_08105 [Clostridia bacterium]|nr:hypothetical protein [Clostridia bacterium]
MLDTITTNVKVDPAWIYGKVLSQPAASVFRSPIYSGDRSFATAYAKTSKLLPVFLKEIKKAISEFEF